MHDECYSEITIHSTRITLVSRNQFPSARRKFLCDSERAFRGLSRLSVVSPLHFARVSGFPLRRGDCVQQSCNEVPDSASRSRLYRNSAKFPKGRSATERGAFPDFTAGKRRRPVYTLCVRIIIKKEGQERMKDPLLPSHGELDPQL